MMHHVLHVAGSDAAAIAKLWWAFLGISMVVYAAVVVALVYGMRRARARQAAGGAEAPARSTQRALLSIAVATGITVVVLLGMLTADFISGSKVLRDDPMDGALRVRITGQQYWWQVEYLDPDPSRHLTTANELHLPVGRPVFLELQARDVIHSFWLPNVAGKRDLIPGRTNWSQFVIDKPGRYEGQCAEFCGYQHAWMRLVMHAQPEAEFEAWRTAQLQGAAQPSEPTAQEGLAVFMRSSCALCHAIQGTDAGGTVGPDLTHIASRDRIATGMLQNDAPHLAAWVSDPQKIKPGVNMPATRLPPRELTALVTYLGSLK